jgi:hypothetical protein
MAERKETHEERRVRRRHSREYAVAGWGDLPRWRSWLGVIPASCAIASAWAVEASWAKRIDTPGSYAPIPASDVPKALSPSDWT